MSGTAKHGWQQKIHGKAKIMQHIISPTHAIIFPVDMDWDNESRMIAHWLLVIKSDSSGGTCLIGAMSTFFTTTRTIFYESIKLSMYFKPVSEL